LIRPKLLLQNLLHYIHQQAPKYGSINPINGTSLLHPLILFVFSATSRYVLSRIVRY
jgi:hypothetical protein